MSSIITRGLCGVAALAMCLTEARGVSGEDRGEPSAPALVERDAVGRVLPVAGAAVLQEAPAPAVEQPGDILRREPGAITLADEPDLRRKLALIKKQLEGDRPHAAAKQLGLLLADPVVPDFFLVGGPGAPGGRSFKTELQKLIAELPPIGRQAYEVEFGTDARRALERGLASDDIEFGLQQVVVRYSGTQAGRDALWHLAAFYRDHQRFREAALCLDRLRQAQPKDTTREPALSLIAAQAWNLSGESRQAITLLTQAKRAHERPGLFRPDRSAVEWFAEDATALKWLSQWLGNGSSQSRGRPVERNWLVARGGPGRNGPVVPVSSPALVPRWSVATTSDAHTLLKVSQDAERARDQGRPLLPMLHPLIVGEQILMRTAQGVHSYSATTGRMLWRYPSDDGDGQSGLRDSLWNDAAFGALASDGACLFLVEPDQVNRELILGQGATPDPLVKRDAAVDPSETVPDDGVTMRQTSLLSAREITPPREGNLRWQVGGKFGLDEPKLAGVSFLGTPLPYAGQLYVLAERKRSLFLICLDIRTGGLRWMQELATIENNLSTDLFRRLSGASPTIAEGLVICPTSAGGVVAIDLITRTLAWAYRYQRTKETLPVETGEVATAPVLSQGNRWVDGTVRVAEQFAVLAPPESAFVHCLNLADGKLVWKHPRTTDIDIAGVQQGVVILLSKEGLRGLKLSDGSPAWKAPLKFPARVFPAGRCLLESTKLYVPLTDGSLWEVSGRDGSATTSRRHVRETALGNLAFGNSVFVSQGREALEVFDEEEPLREAIEKRLRDNPRDAEALFRKGQLDVWGGRLVVGLDALRQSYRERPEAQTRNALIAALLARLATTPPDAAVLEAELLRLSP